MKIKAITTFVIAILFIANYSVIGQEDQESKKTSRDGIQTLFSLNNSNVDHGGFIGLHAGYTNVDNQDALLVGGRIAWLINHQFAVGFSGDGFVNSINKPAEYHVSDYSLAGGYGGFLIQPIIFAKSPVHVSFPITFGAGGVAVTESYYAKDLYDDEHNDFDEDFNCDEDDYVDYDFFLYVEPGVEVEFNMLRFMRMSVGASYRFTNNVNLNYEYEENGSIYSKAVDPNSLNNFNVKLGFYFGWF